MYTLLLLLTALVACDKTPADADGDGFPRGDDCDDTDPAVWPEAPETCDGLDNDCDGTVDEGVSRTWYIDADKDGYGDTATEACAQTEGLAETGGDCDDLDGTVYPGASELCDGLDNDCDPSTVEDIPDWYTDADGDGHGAGDPIAACEAPEGSSALGDDCDDNDASRSPSAEEVCDDADQDCDDEVDEDAVDATEWFPDEDYDGWGDEDAGFRSCESSPPGAVRTGGDCDDRDASVRPDGEETCDGVDQDCDGTPDEDATDAPVWLPDADADGYGDPSGAGVADCDGGAGLSAEGGDCDDTDAAIHPGAEEICEDGLDNNCDGGAWGCTPGGTLDLDTESTWVFTGDASGDGAGFSARPGRGDHNGDGVDDLLLSAPDSSAGTIALFNGPLTADGALSSASAVLTGASSGDRAGLRLSWVGDTDGDGYDDVLVGAPNHDSSKSDVGAAYLLRGPLSSGSLADASAVITGGGRSDYLGIAVTTPGDVNGDGAPDLLVGAYSADTSATDAGAAYLFYSPVSGEVGTSDAELTLLGVSKTDRAGGFVTPAGDSQGDGGVDLLIGATSADTTATDTGAVYVVPGESTGTVTLGTVGITIRGLSASDYAGFQADGGVDGDGDGYDDVVVGVYGDDRGGSGAGAVCFFPGPFSADLDLSDAATTVLGDASGGNAGWSVAWVGDLDQDGQPELAFGAYDISASATGSGAAYVWYGPLSAGTWSASDGEAALWGSSANDGAGSAVSAAGDVTGDGYPDLLVGASGWGSDAGAWYLLTGGGL